MWKIHFLAATLLGSSVWASPRTTLNKENTVSWNASSRLSFEKDGSFKLSIFEDLHFGEGEANPPELGWGPPYDRKTIQVVKTILDVENPNLVILNGDLITGEDTKLHNSTTYLDQIVGPMVQRQIPWAATYGNHDREYNLSPTKLLEREKKLYPKLSLTKSMVTDPDAGTTNYVLPIYPSDPNISTPSLLLYFFDSRGGHEFQRLSPTTNKTIGVPGFVHPSVVRWFESQKSLFLTQYGRDIPSLAFVHIPIYAMAAFQIRPGGVDKNKEPGINEDYPLAPQSIVNDTYTAEDVPFMRALATTPSLKAVFSGHDHGNDWCAKWDGVLPDMDFSGPAQGLAMCFGRRTGYGGYGRWTRGSRQILLREETLGREVETWVRLEDKTISGAVVLNGTYGGVDRYPAVQNTTTN
ncbi:Metallo-dependent phosphatase [Venturia nashicola]|uniref:Metallo-dependent phosphatase n=1 Tax=Venturia nashicola TaxID=86259 RepID=A0A4Z1NZN2_9PEZI|nr:Metallo-dependent phosphatase [Venturia nashicola]